RLHLYIRSFPTRRSSDLGLFSLFEDELDYWENYVSYFSVNILFFYLHGRYVIPRILYLKGWNALKILFIPFAEFATYCLVYVLRSEEHTSELQSRENLVC